MPDDNNLTNTPPVTNEGVAEEIVDNSVGIMKMLIGKKKKC